MRRLLLVAAMAMGCAGPVCEKGHSQCAGDTLMTCSDATREWVVEDCAAGGNVCRDCAALGGPYNGAMCVPPNTGVLCSRG